MVSRFAPRPQFSKNQCKERYEVAKQIPVNFQKKVDIILDNFDAPLPIDSMVTPYP